MSTGDMTSWWPFLTLTVIFYGLLPRLILLGAGIFFFKKAISRIDFSQSLFEGLLQRLYNPVVSSAGHPVANRIPDNNLKIPEPESPDPSSLEQTTSYVLIIPEDIIESHNQDDLLNSVSKVRGISIKKQIVVDEGEDQDNGVFEEITKIHRDDNDPLNIFLILESWQPPIREDLNFIKQIRKTLGDTSKIKIGLIGKPKKDAISSEVKEEEWKTWNQKLKALGDPYLSLERLAKDD
jgi:hypothetical protein